MKRRYIYGLFDSGNLRTIDYVGCTRNLGKRFDCHAKGYDKTTKKWAREVRAAGRTIRLVVLEAATNGKALERERWWIGFLNPQLNFIHREPRRYAPQIEGCNPAFFWPEGTQYFRFTSEMAEFFECSSSSIRRALKLNQSFHSPRFDKFITVQEL